MPATREAFWVAKFNATIERDAASLAALKRLGWTAFVIWECEVGTNKLDLLYHSIVNNSTIR